MSLATIKAIPEAFRQYESMDLRVESVWLHPQQMHDLYADQVVFDRVHSYVVKQALSDCGGTYEGILFGAQVFSSNKVPVGYIGIIPGGFKAQLLDGSGCIPLHIVEEMVGVNPTPLEKAARKVAVALSSELSMNGDRAHHGHLSQPGTCGSCDALRELRALLPPSEDHAS